MRKDFAVISIFGETIRKFRIAKELTQEQLSLVSNVDRSFLARVEQGRVCPSIDTAYALAIGLEITFTQLSESFEQNLRKSRDGTSSSLKSTRSL